MRVMVDDTTDLTPPTPSRPAPSGRGCRARGEDTPRSGGTRLDRPADAQALSRLRRGDRSGLRFLLACALVLLALPAFALNFDCGTLDIAVDDATAQIVGARLPMLGTEFGLTGGLRLTEGVEAREIALAGGSVVDDQPATLRFVPEGEALAVDVAITCNDGWFAWNVTLRNTGDERRLLAVSLPINVPGDGPISAYDGFLPTEELTEAFDGPMYRTPIPLAAAWSEEGGAATGINPRQVLSQIATSGAPLEGGGATVATRAQIVLDPGQTLSVDLFLCGMTGQWGRGEALHYWYASAPELFRPTQGIDPRILDASGQYLAWKRHPEITEDYQVRERARRAHVGWDWCINPFKRAGDIVVREEWYDYTPANPDALAEEDRVTWEEYRARRQERFEVGDRLGVAMLLYTPSQIWLEEQLAREQFPDAIVEDPSVQTRYPKGYVKPQDSVVRVFPYNTSWGEQSKRDLAEVAEQLGLYGFSFDTATGPAKYRGPGMDGLPERGWDEDGPFVREGVAIRRLMDYVHTLKNEDGTTLGVVPNIRSSADYNCCMGADAALFEGEPWKGLRGREWALRDAIGTKPASWWEHYALDSFVDYRNMTRDEIAEAYQGMADFMCIESLHMGFWPTASFARGFQSMTGRYLPRIEDCIDAGWQPVTAARSDDFTWITRYGAGLDTHLAVGNETPEAAEGTLVVANQWLDEDGRVPVFTMYDGAQLRTRITLREMPATETIGDGTMRSRLANVWLEVEGVTVPRRSAEVVTAVAAFDFTAPNYAATASWTGDRISRRLTLDVECGPAPLGDGVVRVPDGMQVTGLKVSGEAKPIEVEDGRLTIDVPDGVCETQVIVAFSSRIIEPPQEKLLDVNFLFEDKPAGFIVLPAEPTEAEEIAAERIVDYFQWYVHSERGVEEPTPFPVVRGEVPRDDSLMILIDRPRTETPKVQLPDMRGLQISAPDDEGLQAAVDELLHVLDAKYVAPPTFVWRRSTNEAGLIGDWLEDPLTSN